jgi:mannose-6-phosphate isomerase-like protein (cupin superfamily)
VILRFRPETEFGTPENCHIVELSNSDKDETCSIARARVEPGITTQLHTLAGTVERYVILEGEGLVEIGSDPPMLMRPLDVAIVPAGATQRITNIGRTDLVFLCICTPRFRPENYAM